MAYTIFADLLHHLRNDLTPAQLTHICSVYVRRLHNPNYNNSVHILSAKMIYTFIEVIIAKDTHQGAARMLTTLLDASVDKVESMADVHAKLVSKVEKIKRGESDTVDFTVIEKSRPVAGATYAIEKPEEVINGTFPHILLSFLLIPFPQNIAPSSVHFCMAFDIFSAALKNVTLPFPMGL